MDFSVFKPVVPVRTVSEPLPTFNTSLLTDEDTDYRKFNNMLWYVLLFYSTINL